MPQKIKSLSLILGVFVMSFLVGCLAFAWTEPTATPPANNVSSPLNVSGTEQWKVGNLGVGLSVAPYSLSSGTIAAESFYDIQQPNNETYFLDPSSDLVSAALRGRVGIGIAVPTHTLHAYSTQPSIPQYYFDTNRLTRVGINSPTTPNPNTGIGFYIGDVLKWSNAVYQGNAGNYDYTIWNDQPPVPAAGLFIDGDTNNVGIGTTEPATKLNVRGGNIGIQADRLLGSGNLYGDPLASSSGTIKLYDGATGDLEISSPAYDVVLQPTTGNVGIGTTQPSHKLDVNGALRLQPSVQPAAAKGVMYFDSGTNTFRCSEDGTTFKPCASGSAVVGTTMLLYGEYAWGGVGGGYTIAACPAGWTEVSLARQGPLWTEGAWTFVTVIKTCYRTDKVCLTMPIYGEYVFGGGGYIIAACPAGWTEVSLARQGAKWSQDVWTFISAIKTCYKCP
jgi:hypothetical protein